MHKGIPAMSSRKFASLLKQHGCRFVRQRGTSHALYERTIGGVTFRAPVVMGKKELSPQYIKPSAEAVGVYGRGDRGDVFWRLMEV